jgi:hypothetical protein
MAADTFDRRPLIDAPKNEWVQLLFSDSFGHWWSNAPYQKAGSYWTAASGMRVPSHLDIIGWREWKDTE